LKAAQYVIGTVQIVYFAARMPKPIIVEVRRDAEISRMSSVPGNDVAEFPRTTIGLNTYLSGSLTIPSVPAAMSCSGGDSPRRDQGPDLAR